MIFDMQWRNLSILPDGGRINKMKGRRSVGCWFWRRAGLRGPGSLASRIRQHLSPGPRVRKGRRGKATQRRTTP